jgi:hypothetical protein
MRFREPSIGSETTGTCRPRPYTDGWSTVVTGITVVTPTMLEYIAGRAVIRGCDIIKSGMGRASGHGMGDSPVILCGLAGGLAPHLVPGTVVIAETVETEHGDRFECDSHLNQALIAGARRLGFVPHLVRQWSSATIVTGQERERRTTEGFEAVDMESAHWARNTNRFACVRVVLDTASHSISEEWLTPGRAVWQPRLWSELLWMGGHAPWYALRAARIVASGVGELTAAHGQSNR